MSTALAGVAISPVNIEDRQSLGLKAGDTVRVHQKIVDPKGKSRIQVFEGTVLARKHGNEPGATFTVRKVASGVGVEKIYPLYSPNIDKIEIVRRAKVRRAKLYYIREKVAREIKRQMRRMSFVNIASESEAEAAQRQAEAEAKAAEEAEQKTAEEAKLAEEQAAAAEEAKEHSTEEATPEETVEEKPEAAAEEVKQEESPAMEAAEEPAAEAEAEGEQEEPAEAPAEEKTEATEEDKTA